MGLLDNIGENQLLNIGLGILANNTGNYGAFGPAVGKGGLQGIQATQQAQLLALQKKLSELQMQRQAMEMKKETREEQEYERKLKARQGLLDTMQGTEQFAGPYADPNMAVQRQVDPVAVNRALMDYDSELAIKAIYAPKKGDPDPFKVLVSTERGLFEHDTRKGGVTQLTDQFGNIIIKDTASPVTQYAVSRAKSKGTGEYQITDKIPGSVMTETQAAHELNPSLALPGNIPGSPSVPIQRALQGSQSAPIQRAPIGQFAGDPQQIVNEIWNSNKPIEMKLEALRALDSQFQSTGGRLQDMPVDMPVDRPGIKVPTPAEALQTKSDIEVSVAKDKEKRERIIKLKEDLPKDSQTLNVVERTTKSLIDEIDKLIGNEDGTIKEHPGLRGSVGYIDANAFVPPFTKYQSDAQALIRGLLNKTSVEGLQSIRQSGSAPGSITEKEWPIFQNYLKTIDPKQSHKQFVDQLKSLRKGTVEFQESARNNFKLKHETQDMGASTILPKDEQMPETPISGAPPIIKATPLPPKPNAMTLKKGVIYDTPKGPLRWNGKAFEDQ